MIMTCEVPDKECSQAFCHVNLEIFLTFYNPEKGNEKKYVDIMVSNVSLKSHDHIMYFIA